MLVWVSHRRTEAVGFSGFAEEARVRLWERPRYGSALFAPAEDLIPPLSSKPSRCSGWRGLLQVFLPSLR